MEYLNNEVLTPPEANAAIMKAHSISSSASEIDGSINRDTKTIVLLGDSLTAGNGSTNPAYPPEYGNVAPAVLEAWDKEYIATSTAGFFTWGNMLAGYPFELLTNSGVGGNNSSQILSRVERDVLAYNPTHCMFLAGTNDEIGSSINTELLKNNLIGIYEKLNNNGIYSFICTIPPSRASKDKCKQTLHVNNWMVNYFKNKPNIEVIDIFSRLIDPLSTDGSGIEAAFRDSTHPNQTGGYLGGLEVKKHFERYKPTINLLSSALDTKEYSTSSNNILRNPLNILRTGGNVASGAISRFTGTSAKYTYMNIGTTASVIGSTEAREDGFGYDQILKITSTGTDILTSFIDFEYSTNTSMQEGDELYFSCNIKIHEGSDCIFKVNPVIFMSIQTRSSELSDVPTGDGNRPIIIPIDGIDMNISSLTYKCGIESSVPAVKIKISCCAIGTAKISIGRIALWNKNKNIA